MTCPSCRKYIYPPQTLEDHNCSGSIHEQIDAEIALVNERQRGGTSIPLPSTCMVCGQWKPCVRCVDIGWVCLDCVESSGHRR